MDDLAAGPVSRRVTRYVGHITTLAEPLKHGQLPRVCNIELRRYLRNGKDGWSKECTLHVHVRSSYQRIGVGCFRFAIFIDQVCRTVRAT